MPVQPAQDVQVFLRAVRALERPGPRQLDAVQAKLTLDAFEAVRDVPPVEQYCADDDFYFMSPCPAR